MSKRLAALLTAALLLCGCAYAEESFDGTVVAGETVSVTAPFGGTVQSVALREGASIHVGDAVATLAATRTLSPVDGTVRGVFAQPGDSAEQTVLTLAPVSKYTISASIGKAYSSVATKYVRIGETVYIRCSADGTHKAVGVITSVSGSDYTVQTTAGELYMEETVYLYRSDAYESSTRIGSGTVGRTPEIVLKGTGSLLSLHVKDGDEVERGQLLFETVEGSLDALLPSGNQILSDAEGVVAALQVKTGAKVNKGDVLLTVYPSTYQITFSVPEELLPQVTPGAAVAIRFNWDEAGAHACEGTVASVSYVSDAAQGEEATYTGYVTFTADESVRIGMGVTLTLE